MILSWADNAWDDYLYWQQTDKNIPDYPQLTAIFQKCTII